MAMKLDVEPWRSLPGMALLLDALGADKGLTRFVGGAVRDALLGLEGTDLDLATRLRPDEVVARLEAAGIKAVPTGIEHGTITAISEGQVVEVTTLRRDVSTDGRRATVAFTDDWKEDAARRDFTINALSADAVTGQLFDYFSGLADLESRTVRFIGDPLERIAEDHLRILRFFRFHARFGLGAPDGQALDACAARARDLMALSRERIADELLKLLGLPDPVETVHLMLERGIFQPVIPEVADDAVARLSNLVSAERQAEIEPDALRRAAALLPPEPGLVEKIGFRLKLSNKARTRLSCAAGSGDGDPRAIAYRCGAPCAIDRMLLAGRAEAAMSLIGWEIPKLPLSGGMLIGRGLRQGPVVARTLRAIEDQWIAAGFPEGDDFERIVEVQLAASREPPP